MSIIVLGTVALDTVRTPSGLRKDMLGGSAAHFAMAGRLFAPVNLVAVVGSDFPDGYIRFLKAKGVGLRSLSRSEGKTFRWRGKYEGDLNTAVTLNTQLGVLSGFEPDISREQRRIKHIFLANVDPEIQGRFLAKMLNPNLVGLDSMNYWIEHKRNTLLRMLRRVDIYVANDQEARALTGETNLVKAARSLRSLGPKLILIKKGEHGAFLYSDRFQFCLPAYPTDRVIDPTGAGDTFAGGFMGYLSRARRINAQSLKKAVAYGTVAASFNVEGFGLSKTSKIRTRDLEGRLKKFRATVSF